MLRPISNQNQNNGGSTLRTNVLILNQNYEPLFICHAKKAIVLLYLDKAEILEAYDFHIHSVSSTFPYPSVIRLKRYFRRPYKEIALNRKNIIKRDRHICQYCGKNTQAMTVDHVIPKCFGGEESWSNLVCACLRCNTTKGNRTPEQAGMKLLRKPKKPTHLFFLQYHINAPHDTWKPYLFLN